MQETNNTRPVYSIEEEAYDFAKNYGKGMGRRMLAAMAKIEKRSDLLVKIGLWGSLPHQMLFLASLTIPDLHISGWFDILGIVHVLEKLLMVVVPPVMADILMLSAIEKIGLPVTRGNRIWAFIVLFAVGGVSAYVNITAPAPVPLLNWLAGFVVIAIVLNQFIRVVIPDFRKLKQQQEDVVSPVALDGPTQAELVELAVRRRMDEIEAEEAERHKARAAKAQATKAENLEREAEKAARRRARWDEIKAERRKAKERLDLESAVMHAELELGPDASAPISPAMAGGIEGQEKLF